MTEEIIQGSPEWHQMRLGKITASRIADLTAKTKTGYSTSRANYMAQLVVEILTGAPTESFVSPAMQWGTEMEPQARETYSFYTGQRVEQVAFITHPTIGVSGCSPDGLVGEDGMVEIKAPLTATHIETLLSQRIPSQYIKQMQWQMACAGRQWCDFVSYDPRLPENMRLFIARLERDYEMISELQKEVLAFIAELDKKLTQLNNLYGKGPVA